MGQGFFVSFRLQPYPNPSKWVSGSAAQELKIRAGWSRLYGATAKKGRWPEGPDEV